MKRSSRFKTLRDFVESHPRTISQGQIAAELGLAPNTLSQYLHGRRIPSRDIALRLSRQCGIPLENLLDPELARTA